MLGPSKSFCLFWETGGGERVLNIPAGSWQFCLGLCFLLAQSLKVSQRALFFSGMCTALHMCDILDFQESIEDIEAPHEHHTPQLFLSGFWSPQLLWQPQATVNAKQLMLIVWASSKSSPVKTSPWTWDCQTGQIIKILQGWGVWGSSTPVCVLQQFLGCYYHDCEAIGFLGYSRSEEKGMGM